MTVADSRKRFNEHLYNARRGVNYPLYLAIRKYGIDRTHFQVLVIANTRDYLEQLERSAISVFNTRLPFGYNLTDGGDGAPVGNQYQLGLKRSLVCRMKMSMSRRGKPRVLSTEYRETLRLSMLGNKHALGRKMSEEERGVRSIAQRGKRKGNGSGVCGVTFDGQTKKWRATITIRGSTIHLGRYNTIKQAASARLAGEHKYFVVGQL